MRARVYVLSLLLAAGSATVADEPGYRLSVAPVVRDSQLTVAPRISAPPGKQLRYEMVSTKHGAAGRSSTSQSGRVVVDAGGAAALSTLKLGIAAGDRYTVAVKVYDGTKLVAEDVLHYPRE